MPERVPAPRPGEASNGLAGSEPDEGLSSLRSILVGPEQRHVAALQARLDDPERRAEEIGEVLPRVLARHAQDPEVARALTPPIERAITSSVQRNPRPLAEALFPIMGPAIRKAVATGLSGMVESLGRALEHSLSPRSLGWRLEAMRTGRSFAEVVLLKTLLYRVEQVFLIDARTGLLLQHVQAQVEGVRDADMVSGMLTAIGDFVRDSFQVSDHAALDLLEVGDLHVWIERGPHAILAAVVRGTAPREYRVMLQDALETLHLQFGDLLASFDGDASALEPARPILEDCLRTQFLPEQRKSGRVGALVFAAAGLILLTWLALTVRDNLRWRRYLEALHAQPGIAVVSAERSRGRFVVTGLRDPLAADPVPLLAGTGLTPEDVVGRWTPYYALDPEIVLARAHDVLAPPPGVALSLENGVLASAGPAPAAWVAEARRVAPLLAGVRRFDVGGAVEAGLQATLAALGEDVLFPKGSSRPAEGQEEAVARLAGALRELAAFAEAGGRRFRVEVVGHTDEDGAPETNASLSLARAQTVRAALASAVTPALDLRVLGVGSTEPAVAGLTEDDKQRNRRVSVRVTPLD